jgi:hypothetical protein
MARPQRLLPRRRADLPHLLHQRPRRRGDGDRQETWEDSPEGYPQSAPYQWWRWHDDYAAEIAPDPKWVEVSDAGVAAFEAKLSSCCGDET